MEKFLLSFISAVIGFALSQSFNLVSFIRRPKFRVKNWSDGVVSNYTGDPPDTPWEIDLGLYLENNGKNPAKNTRVFVSDIRTAKNSLDNLELTSIDLMELKRPVDFIPPGECVLVRLGKISGDTCELNLNLHSAIDEDCAGMIGADTRGCVRFSAKFFVSCDDENSFHTFDLDFRPDENDWSSSFFEDYTQEYLRDVTLPK